MLLSCAGVFHTARNAHAVRRDGHVASTSSTRCASAHDGKVVCAADMILLFTVYCFAENAVSKLRDKNTQSRRGLQRWASSAATCSEVDKRYYHAAAFDLD